MKTYDAVIIGGGCMGASVAFHEAVAFALQDYDVLLIASSEDAPLLQLLNQQLARIPDEVMSTIRVRSNRGCRRGFDGSR